MFEKYLIVLIKMDLALNNMQRLICHKRKKKKNNQQTNTTYFYLIVVI